MNENYYESESALENKLISFLNKNDYEKISVKSISDLEKNLKLQLEKINNKKFSDKEFSQILNYLNRGNVFEKAKKLRDRFLVKVDEGENYYIDFLKKNSQENIFQVTNQIESEKKFKNRYDVTLLINGFPLIQIELKRRGVEMKQAFNQINRYHKHSFQGLFEYVQVFVMSNRVNTKYFSNNYGQPFEQTFYWTDEENQKIPEIFDFSKIFFNQEFLIKYIWEYIVLAEAKKRILVLRPYQYYAIKAIEKQVSESEKNGFIWHTTGSGKTLTSFKTAKILSEKTEIKKVLFVVDRKDLDVQTMIEFNSFEDKSVDGSEDTKTLVNNLADRNKKILVTTIQKFDRALKDERYRKKFDFLENEKVVIIFDEAHRGQFGDTNKRIRKFFKNSQLIGFTGTPIFKENSNNGLTTADIFEDVLHKYIITNAIDDQNVLGFKVEYYGKYIQKNEVDGEAKSQNLDKKEVYEDYDFIKKKVEFLLKDWKKKTSNGYFNAILAVSSVPVLQKYYKAMAELKDDDFNIATIFSWQANEEDREDGSLDSDDEQKFFDQGSLDFFNDYVLPDYNKTYGTNFSYQDFERYRKDLQEKVKDSDGRFKKDGKKIDLVLVVNMLLTGFDAPQLNTLYIDKNLKYHGLIQAYSRTNRIFGSKKPRGNIVSFRNLKANEDKALEMYGDKDKAGEVFGVDYEDRLKDFNQKIKDLKEYVSEDIAVDLLQGDDAKRKFIELFREVLKAKVLVETYIEFDWKDTEFFGVQEFENYKSKYYDTYQEIKKDASEGKESILEDIDFELELVLSEDIDYDYIINLLLKLGKKKGGSFEKEKERILKELKNNISLKNKQELIEKFIKENLPQIKEGESVKEKFEDFWERERQKYLDSIIEKEGYQKEKIENIISEYMETEKMAFSDDLIQILPEEKRPGLLEEKKVVSKIKSVIFEFMDKFEWNF